ncbi:MAG: ribosomal protein L7/L12 [Novosphingobium sp.]
MEWQAIDYVTLLAVAAIAFALGRATGRRTGPARDPLSGAPNPPRPAMRPADLPPETLAQIKTALAARQKIEAIRIAREATGLGLKDAKELVEGLEA